MGKRDHEREVEGEADTEAGRDGVVVCAACDATLTHAREAIAVEGRHAHDFVNPSGVAFRVRCFARVDGAAHVGEASTFFSWFVGHAWRIALCARCGTHVGWRFEGAEGAFHGLIAERIVERA
jgi:hypothetical protein